MSAITYKCLDFENNRLDKTPFEQMHNKACKNILGIRNNASGKAAKAELGRYPVIIYLAQIAIKYYQKISADCNKLTYHALVSETMLHSEGKTSWVSYLAKILDLTTNTPYTLGCQLNHKSISKPLENKYNKFFFDSINSEWGNTRVQGNKLRTYAKFKHSYSMEKYLNLAMPRHIIANLTRFRLSAHNLAIDTGRYTRPVTPSHERFCQVCQQNFVEDEIHFLFQCNEYQELRSNLYDKINIPQESTDEEKLNTLMNLDCEDSTKTVANYLYHITQARKNKLNPQ